MVILKLIDKECDILLQFIEKSIVIFQDYLLQLMALYITMV